MIVKEVLLSWAYFPVERVFAIFSYCCMGIERNSLLLFLLVLHAAFLLASHKRGASWLIRSTLLTAAAIGMCKCSSEELRELVIQPKIFCTCQKLIDCSSGGGVFGRRRRRRRSWRWRKKMWNCTNTCKQRTTTATHYYRGAFCVPRLPDFKCPCRKAIFFFPSSWSSIS